MLLRAFSSSLIKAQAITASKSMLLTSKQGIFHCLAVLTCTRYFDPIRMKEGSSCRVPSARTFSTRSVVDTYSLLRINTHIQRRKQLPHSLRHDFLNSVCRSSSARPSSACSPPSSRPPSECSLSSSRPPSGSSPSELFEVRRLSLSSSSPLITIE